MDKATILISIAQSLAVIALAYILFRKKLANLRKTEAEAEESVSKNYANLLEEYRKRTKEDVAALEFQYNLRTSELQAEVIRLNKKIDDLIDEINAQKTIAVKRQEQLEEAINDKEYYRGKYNSSTEIIDKHLKKTA
jgi:type II secretory pathway pseudopilin PulG